MLRKFDYPWFLLKRSLWLILPTIGIAMTEGKLNKQRCADLIISIKGDSGARFLNQMDVRMLLTENGGDPLLGNRLDDVALNDLENRVTRNRLIKKCQVYRDLKGNIVAEVEQEKPLARWLKNWENGEMRDASGHYINHEGVFFPLSESYSARTLLVSGPFFNNQKKLQGPKGAPVLELLRFLNTDPFWKAQIAHLDAGADGEISLLTVLGDQRVEFGTADDYVDKFRKLRVFYDKVLSQDWSRYKKISVKFQDQIVCE